MKKLFECPHGSIYCVYKGKKVWLSPAEFKKKGEDDPADPPVKVPKKKPAGEDDPDDHRTEPDDSIL